MARMSRARIVWSLALVVIAVGSIAAASSTPPADLETAAREYRASLADLLPLREAAAEQARATAATRRRLAEDGLVARRDAEAAEQALAAAERAVLATRAEIDQADRLVAEALAVALLPPGKPGVLTVTPTLLRYHGTTDWTLAQVAALERFFAARFGRALPVSAFGQTPAHDRLGFDHRNALDVAVHPDSAEGRALMTWLRARSVSFLAFRGPVAGEATGAHLHVGEPSPRRAPARVGLSAAP
jgi:hypothetical protein